MKKLVLLTLIALTMAIPCFGDATRWNIRQRPTADWLTGATGNKDTAWAWMKAIDLLVGGSNVNQGTVYYVDNNSGLDTHDGLSWDHAVLTITKAMALSHAIIATSPHYADRNTIFVRGDDFDEDWTLLAQKTDIIGVGSDDGSSYPTVKGNHAITAMTGDTTFMGCKFYNMGFQPQTASALWDIPANQHQIEFHYCTFQQAANSIYGITAVSVNGLVIKNCRFIRDTGTPYGFLTAAINIGNGTIVHTDIADNFIDAEVGIAVYNVSSLGGRITGNLIHATTLTIDENSDTFWIADNTLISDGRKEQCFDFNQKKAANNTVTHAGGTVTIPYTENCAGAIAAYARGAHGQIYYVDGNMTADTGDGLSWETAKKLLASALALSQTNTGTDRNWANRNTIYYTCDTDTTAENLTSLARRTDIVGVGAYSSYGGKAVLNGKHTITGATWGGCRFFNIVFLPEANADPIFTIPAGNHGIEYHNCVFVGNVTNTTGILSTANQGLIVEESRFVGLDTASCFSTACISIGAGDNNNTVIEDNIFVGNVGVLINATQTGLNCWIKDNFFRVLTFAVDDDSDEWYVANNQWISTNTVGASYDLDLEHAVGNIATGSDDTKNVPAND